jgi:CyaY protein
MSAPPASRTRTPLSEPAYEALVRHVLSRVEAACDAFLQSDVCDIDTHRSGGLLELSFPGGSKIIINAQPPLQELWLAARAGGFHYGHVAGAWLDTRDGSEFFAELSRHASAQAGQPLLFTAADEA